VDGCLHYMAITSPGRGLRAYQPDIRGPTAAVAGILSCAMAVNAADEFLANYRTNPFTLKKLVSDEELFYLRLRTPGSRAAIAVYQPRYQAVRKEDNFSVRRGRCFARNRTVFDGALGPDSTVTMPFYLYHRWNGLNSNNSPLRALEKRAREKQYTLVNANGVNAIFVRDDLVSNREGFRFEDTCTRLELHPSDPNAVWIEV